jgi:hypothetical protein
MPQMGLIRFWSLKSCHDVIVIAVDQWHGHSISAVSGRIRLIRGMEKPFREEDL